MQMNKKTIIVIISIILSLVAGFFIGRKTIKLPEPKPPVYIPGDTVYQEIKVPYPVEIKTPVDTSNLIAYCVRNGLFTELFPVKDSIIYINPQTKDDSLKIYMVIASDWVKERRYQQSLFNVDTLGTCDIDLTVSNNKLQTLNYTYIPVIKQIETVVEYKKKFSPFVGAGFTTIPAIVGQAGIFFEDKYGFSYLYQYDYTNKQHIHGGTFLIKF